MRMWNILYTAAIVTMLVVMYFGGLFVMAMVLASHRLRKSMGNADRYLSDSWIRNAHHHRKKERLGQDLTGLKYNNWEIKHDRQKIIKESLWLATAWPVGAPLWIVFVVGQWIVRLVVRTATRMVADPLMRNLDAQVGPSPVELKLENERLRAEQARHEQELKRLERVEAERDDIAEALAREEEQRKEIQNA